MNYSLPTGQTDTINEALKYVAENVFVAKAIHLRTIFTCAGLSNDTNAEEANAEFDKQTKALSLETIYRKAVSLWWSVGLVPILLPEPGQPLTWVEILDPRQVRTFTSFGQTVMNLIPDMRMVNAARTYNTTSDILVRQYWQTIPEKWKAQLLTYIKNGVRDPEKMMIELTPGSYIAIENMDMPFSRERGYFDGSPLQPYFAACKQYQQLASGDFAAGFVAKNLIALVSVGDPQTEGLNYQRPSPEVLQNLRASMSTPNEAQYIFSDPTTNIRYITPDPETFGQAKYAEIKECIKNLLPSPFWYNDGSGSFAASTTEMTWLQQEIDHCHDVFDRLFFLPIYQRIAQGNKRLSTKNIKPPSHQKSNLKDPAQHLQDVTTLYNNGGLSVDSLVREHGFDPDKEREKLKQQQNDVKARVWSPAFESQQGIVADTLGVSSGNGSENNKDSGKKDNGRPTEPGAKPQSETKSNPTPRPNTKVKADNV